MNGEVKCGECRTIVADDSLLPEEDRTPCPNCGATTRLRAVGSSLTVLWNVEASTTLDVDDALHAHTADEVRITVEGTQAVETDTAMPGSAVVRPATLIEFPFVADSTFELRIAKEGSSIFFEVSHGGRVIGVGQGDDPVDALLSMLPYMLPPDHPDYPKLPEW